jgi:hypothetical protein
MNHSVIFYNISRQESSEKFLPSKVNEAEGFS